MLTLGRADMESKANWTKLILVLTMYTLASLGSADKAPKLTELN